MHSSFFLQYCVSKLTVLELLLKIAQDVSDEIILELLLPYMLFLVNDSLPHVTAQALKIKFLISLSTTSAQYALQ